MKVLVADDELVTRQMIAGALQHAGYQVDTAEDGHQALQILEQGKHQLLISDWDMPKVNGLQLCKAVRSGNFDRYIYTILVTSNDQSQDVIEGLNAGADDFVSKPCNPAEIIVRLRTGQRLLSLESAEMTIFAMAKLAESRDPETGAHLERVRSYSKTIARQLSQNPKYADTIDPNYCNLIYQTSPLHDIGKVAIPDCVLLKAGRLTPEEFDIMKSHATQGAQTLDAAIAKYPNAKFLHMARDIALTHHEKFDGTGYPQGLAGQDIPLCGRIVAVADVYDALTSKRVYKEAFNHIVASNIINEDAGKHFDPDIVQAFNQCEQQIIAIKNHYDNDDPEINNLAA